MDELLHQKLPEEIWQMGGRNVCSGNGRCQKETSKHCLAGSTHKGWRFQTETNNSLHSYG